MILSGLVVLASAGLVVVAFGVPARSGEGLPVFLKALGILGALGLMVWLAVKVLAAGMRRSGTRAKIAAGLLVMAGLFVPTSLLVDPHPEFQPPYGTLVPIALLALLSAALVGVSLLFAASLEDYRSQRAAGETPGEIIIMKRKPGGWSSALRTHTVAAQGLLGLMLLAKALHNFYWLIIWDSTYDPLDTLWLAPVILAALLGALAMLVVLPDKTRFAGLLYAALIPALLTAAAASAKRVDTRELTQARAEQIIQAVERYHARRGAYPESLRQLWPRDLLSVPEPVLMNGVGWCYDAGEGYYRLGAIDREHWSSPILFGRLYGAAGEAPQSVPLCAQELVTLLRSLPEYYSVKLE